MFPVLRRAGQRLYGQSMTVSPGQPERWVKLLDQDRCIGCYACTTACKSENDVPLGVTRTFVKSVDVGGVPAGASFVPGDPVQSVHGRAVCGGVPDGGDVQAAGRDRRL